MTNIDRVRVALTGFPGAPGVCTFYALDGASLLGPLQTMWTALRVQIPSDVVIQVANTGDTIDDTNGVLIKTWAGAVQSPITGQDGGSYSAPSGMCITWITEQIYSGKRLRGRTFVVPLSGASYANNGSLIPGVTTGTTGIAAQYVTNTAGNAVLWHRPKFGPKVALPAVRTILRVGAHGIVTSSSVKDKVTVLRSRRD